MYNYNPYDPFGDWDDDDENFGVTVPDVELKSKKEIKTETKKKETKKRKPGDMCICEKEVWMNIGCQCGAIEPYELKPNKNTKHYL